MRNIYLSIHFDLVAQHILELQSETERHGKKVIINTNLKDEFFTTTNSKKLKSSGIYAVQRLSILINSPHDNHYHIDFEVK